MYSGFITDAIYPYKHFTMKGRMERGLQYIPTDGCCNIIKEIETTV